MSPASRGNRHDGFDSMRRVEAADAVHQIVSTDPSSPPDTLATQLAKVGRASDFVSGRHRWLLRRWLGSYLQPLLETIDGQEFILEIERRQPTEGTEA